MSHRALQRQLESSKPVTHTCPNCKAPVKCDVEQGKSVCWCFSVKPQQREVDWDGLCLCKACLKG